MAEQAQQQLKQPPDLTKLPNFDAAMDWIKERERAGHNFGPIKKWMELLLDWCEAAGERFRRAEEEEKEEISKLKSDLEDADIDAARFHALRQRPQLPSRGMRGDVQCLRHVVKGERLGLADHPVTDLLHLHLDVALAPPVRGDR